MLLLFKIEGSLLPFLVSVNVAYILPMSSNPEFNQYIGNVIRTNRKRAAISQAVLAERAGVTRRFIQELENGRSDISLHTLFRLAFALETSLGKLCLEIDGSIKNLPQTASAAVAQEKQDTVGS